MRTLAVVAFAIVVVAVVGGSVVAICCNSTHADTPTQARLKRSRHWSDKATLSTRVAERSVGGFNEEERSAYKRGLQHVLNQHGKIGSFTIAEIVSGQEARDVKRLADRIRERARAAEAARQRDEARDRERQRIAAARERAAAAAAYERDHHDYCADALNSEKVASSDAYSYTGASGTQVGRMES